MRDHKWELYSRRHRSQRQETSICLLLRSHGRERFPVRDIVSNLQHTHPCCQVRASPVLRRIISCYSQEVIKGKGKCGRKRKSAALEADEQEPKVACVAKDAMNDKGKRGQKRKSAAQEVDEPEMARVIEAPKPWRAPVARMI
ncbi:hypothetical protein B0O99DRAFT_396786 [Bisporella sp. PMI_857]|nr:hypothetical protein B0O99DRAFT_396786 [Bisporella sp. PMI_857]